MTKKKSRNSDMDKNYPAIANAIEEQNHISQVTAISRIKAHIVDPKVVTISGRERRFKPDDQSLDKITRDMFTKYGIELTMKPNSLGALNISVTNKGSLTEQQAKFIVREAFSTQDKMTVQINEKLIKKLSDKRYIESLAMNRYLFMRTDYHNNQLVLEGGKESVSQAYKEIQDFIAWNTDSISVVLDIPLVLHDFIRGPSSSNLNTILENSGKYVNITFEKPSRNQLTIYGNSKCVEKAKDHIISLQSRLNSSLIIKSFVLPAYQYSAFMKSIPSELFKTKQVSVVSIETKDNSFSVEVAGESYKVQDILDILNQVLRENFATVIECPYWICKYLSSVNDLESVLSKTHDKISIDFVPHQEALTVFCHENVTMEMVSKIRGVIEEFKKEGYYNCLVLPGGLYRIFEAGNREELSNIEKITVTSIFIDCNIDKLSVTRSNGTDFVHVSSLKNAQKGLEVSKTLDKNLDIIVQDLDSLKDTSTTSISIESTSEAICLIVGIGEQVKKATTMIKDLILFYESFITMNISVPNHLHRYLIGVKGKTLNEMIKSYGENCTISFGKEPPNLESCVVRGPSNEVACLTDALKKKVVEFDRIHHMAEIEYSCRIRELLINEKDFLINALSKFGEVDTIIFPSAENSSINRITIIGKKDVVEQYTKYLNNHLKLLAVSVTKYVSFSEKLIPVLNDFGHAIVKVITDDVGSVINMKFPKKICKNEKIELFGPPDRLAAATAILKKLETCSSDYCFELVKVSSGLIPKLKGQIFDIIKNSGVRIYFSSANKNISDECVLIIGNQSGVIGVKNAIKETISTIQNTVDQIIHIKADYKKDFLKKRNSQDTLVQKISEEHGGVRIYLGERQPGVDTISVEIRGNKENVAKAISSMNTHIMSFDKRVEKQIQFEISMLNSILSKNRQLLKDTMGQYNVVLSISENYYQALRDHKIEGTCEMVVRGQPDNVKSTIEYLNGWVISVETFHCPHYLQRSLFNPRSQAFYSLTRVMNVDLDLGYMHDPIVDNIIINGFKESVIKSMEYMNSIIEANYELRVSVAKEYFTRLIGKKGQFINNFNLENNVTVRIPSNVSDLSDVSIFGKKCDCLLAEKKICELIDTWKATIIKNFEIDNGIRFKLCGVQNENLRHLAKNYNVMASLIPVEERNPAFRTIKVSGIPDNVDTFIKAVHAEIISINEEFGQEYLYDTHKNLNNYEIDISAFSNASNPDGLKQNRKKKNIKKTRNYDQDVLPSLLNRNQRLESTNIVKGSNSLQCNSNTEKI